MVAFGSTIEFRDTPSWLAFIEWSSFASLENSSLWMGVDEAEPFCAASMYVVDCNSHGPCTAWVSAVSINSTIPWSWDNQKDVKTHSSLYAAEKREERSSRGKSVWAYAVAYPGYLIPRKEKVLCRTYAQLDEGRNVEHQFGLSSFTDVPNPSLNISPANPEQRSPQSIRLPLSVQTLLTSSLVLSPSPPVALPRGAMDESRYRRRSARAQGWYHIRGHHLLI